MRPAWGGAGHAGEAELMDSDALSRLTPWLADHIAGFQGPVTVEKFASGQSNPTFRLTTPGADYVLRRKPPGQLLKSAHAVDREFRVQKALARIERLCQFENNMRTFCGRRS